MEFGVTFPQTDIEPNPEAVRRFAARVEELGFEHLLAYDHILGVKPPRDDWEGPYDYTDQFLEPFVLFGQLASVTTDLQFITGVLVLPQREPVLVAKQAATLDVLSDGRFILGAGVGWNDREYGNLGMDFRTRGRRIEEQIDLMRALWTDELVEFAGEWYEVRDAGIAPRPTGGSIPLWLGGGADVVLDRIARTADGWIAPRVPIPEFESMLTTLHDSLQAAGRDPDDLPIHARVKLADHESDGWLDRIEAYERLGVSRVGLGTMDMGYTDAGAHLAPLEDAMETLADHGWV